MTRTRVVVLLLLASTSVRARAQPASWVDAREAQQTFDHLRMICEKDAGALWGATLCGPVMLVDPRSRALVANVRPGAAQSSAIGGLFLSTLPASENIANTSVTWAGALWAQVSLPLPEAVETRDTLLVHESFHRLQAEEKWAFKDERGTNGHLDALDGRVLLQLEWRALRTALAASGGVQRSAIRDALSFRLARRRQYPKAAAEERELEWHEGLAEYTGVKLVTEDVERQRELVREALAKAPSRDSFVRSFAYASGPAYGLLLDQSGHAWREAAKRGVDLGELLAAATGLQAEAPKRGEVDARAKAYEGDALKRAEELRQRTAIEIKRGLRKKLVEGAVLMLPMSKPNIQFNPGNLVPLDELGTVYPTAHLVDEWGVLSVTSDVLIDPQWKTAVVAAPTDPSSKTLHGAGWMLELNRGWSIVEGRRRGDVTVARSHADPQ